MPALSEVLASGGMPCALFVRRLGVCMVADHTKAFRWLRVVFLPWKRKGPGRTLAMSAIGSPRGMLYGRNAKR